MKEQQNLKPVIEAILLVSGDPVGLKNLAGFLKLGEAKLVQEIEQLKEDYRQAGSGFTLVLQKDWVQLVSSAETSQAVAEFLQKEINEKISEAAAEVLAIVAYRGPISRAEIDYIRGVNCGFLLRNLSLRGLVDRKENPLDNRSFIYEASLDFLKSLGVGRLEELPDYAILKKRGQEVFSEMEKETQPPKPAGVGS